MADPQTTPKQLIEWLESFFSCDPNHRMQDNNYAAAIRDFMIRHTDPLTGDDTPSGGCLCRRCATMPKADTTIDYEAAYRRLRQAAMNARALIGGSFWEKPRAVQEGNLNEAWHDLDDAIYDYLPTRTP